MKYYLLDLGLSMIDQWHHDHVERVGRSAAAVAEDYAQETDEDCADGQSRDFVVAESPDGTGAVMLTVRTRVEISYSAGHEKLVTVPPPALDDD